MPHLPDGFTYISEFVTEQEERELLGIIAGIEFREFQMHGVTAKRRIAHFGWHYSFDSHALSPASPMPEGLEDVRRRAAVLAGIEPSAFAETLITEYTPGAGIGWHRDAPPFGIIAGLSLAGACRMRFQKGKGDERHTAAVDLEPRSCYVIAGDARTKWQHMIPPTKALRYSITFRSLRRART
jgi:alkylated DNA repair dioxygenase AlkB